MKAGFADIDAYINSFPESTRKILEDLRSAIKEEAPEAQEAIKYAIPTYVLDGNLVHFAAYENHVGFYATPSGQTAFEKELSGYKRGKGSVQFPIDQPLPLELIRKIVRFRVIENSEKARLKKEIGRCKNGHQYHKSSDCPVCPVCEKNREPSESFLSRLAAPARRALENRGLVTEESVARHTEKEILQLHGMGKSSLPILREALAQQGLSFRDR